MGLERTLYGDALEFERKQQKAFSLGLLTDTIGTVVLPKAAMAAQLPAGGAHKEALLSEAVDDAQAAIDTSPALTPTNKDQKSRTTRQIIERAFAHALPPEEKVLLDPNRPAETVVERISMIESGDDPTASNPGSSALGKHQWLAGTWLGLVRKHRPDLAKGKRDAQISELRKDPALSCVDGPVSARVNLD